MDSSVSQFRKQTIVFGLVPRFLGKCRHWKVGGGEAVFLVLLSKGTVMFSKHFSKIEMISDIELKTVIRNNIFRSNIAGVCASG